MDPSEELAISFFDESDTLYLYMPTGKNFLQVVG